MGRPLRRGSLVGFILREDCSEPKLKAGTPFRGEVRVPDAQIRVERNHLDEINFIVEYISECFGDQRIRLRVIGNIVSGDFGSLI